MKKITFYGSGRDSKNINADIPEVDLVVEKIKEYYDTLLFGGTNIGLMGKFAEKAINSDMKVISIIPKWIAREYPDIVFNRGKIIKVDSLAERKKQLNNTSAIICYPGGIGTLDEIFDVLARIQMEKLKPIPVILYNFERFYSPLLLQIEYSLEVGFIKPNLMKNLYTFEQVGQLSKILREINK